MIREHRELYFSAMSRETPPPSPSSYIFLNTKSYPVVHFREENYPEELDVAAMLPAVWEKHSEVQLDAPVEEYRLGK